MAVAKVNSNHEAILPTGGLPTVAIVGRANVGKSSLFNRLVGRRQAITHDAAGTTRDSIQGVVEWGRYNFRLLDTAGLKAAENDMEVQIRDQIQQAAAGADVIMVVADASGMATSEDREAAKLALKTGKPVVLALNKIDAARGGAEDFSALGIKTVIEVSALHGRGTGELLDAVTANFKPVAAKTEADVLRIAILGRPNVGKSSLLNSLAKKQHSVVNASAGTTRDVNTTVVRYHQRPIELLDTAGLRRRGKILPGVEKFSTMRTMAAIEQADVCLLVMDATELSVAGDQHIAGLVTEAGKGLILVVNKWDALEKDDKTRDQLARRIQHDFQFAWWAPLIFTSAATGLNVVKILQLAAEIAERRQTQVPTGPLNRLIETLVAKHPPAGLKRRQPKVNYATQVAVEPPTFAVFTNHPSLIHFSWKRYLENGLRDAYDFTGTPIKIEFRDKRGDK